MYYDRDIKSLFMNNILKLSVLAFIILAGALFYFSNFALAGVCSYQNNYCSNNIENNYPSCTYHAYKDCAGNSVYWFNSCGNSQDLFQNCSGNNQICKYGQCSVYYNPAPAPVYTNHYQINCFNNSLYWYDSAGSIQNLYKNCADANPCTNDICSSSKCQNPLRCDGATCTIGSQYYCNSCSSIGDNSCNCGETTATSPNDCKENITADLSVKFFSRKDINAISWDKVIQVGPNGNIYFLIIIKNNSTTTPVDNITVSVNIPSEISLLGNLKIDNVATAGDIVSGINISSLPANVSKTITFEGKTQTFTSSGDKQAIINISAGGITQSDSTTISLNPGQQAASVSSAPGASGFMEFSKRWYLWILVAVVLILLFIIIFRRLSSNI